VIRSAPLVPLLAYAQNALDSFQNRDSRWTEGFMRIAMIGTGYVALVRRAMAQPVVIDLRNV
jgi:hypothetical protein